MSNARCPWARRELDIQYHDQEWGVPVTDDRLLFEFLILEGAQAGLSWSTILAKRENYRAAFDGFDPNKIARYSPARVDKLMLNSGIVRNRLKITAAIDNARAFLGLAREFEGKGGVTAYLWGFVGHRPIVNERRTAQEVPARTPEADAMSKELRKRGFRFVGPTICYAFMQAVGMVNDHLVSCDRHATLAQAARRFRL
ncbi:MAG: DNA-3-methyladenine glycosylase I [Phycisphaerales bacterium]|nr:DNA-3-methyladenine glycosylase I [Phycisphaerales bacterium]